MTKRLIAPDELFRQIACPHSWRSWLRVDGPKRWRFIHPSATSDHEQPRLVVHRGIRRYEIEFSPPADEWTQQQWMANDGESALDGAMDTFLARYGYPARPRIRWASGAGRLWVANLEVEPAKFLFLRLTAMVEALVPRIELIRQRDSTVGSR